jgi:uncharacterized protein (TIGR02284 family)
METKREELVDKLRDIFKNNVDAQKGYETAAQNAESDTLKEFFRRKSKQRAEFKENLEQEITAGYGQVFEEGSTTGAMHRTWMDIKAFFIGNSDEAMLEECLLGDKAAIDDFEDILKEERLPVNLTTIIRDQHIKIRTDLNQFKTLEEIYKGTGRA